MIKEAISQVGKSLRPRLVLELTSERSTDIKRVMQETGIRTQAEFVNTAVAVFLWAVEQKKAGRYIASVDPEQKGYKELVVPALETVSVCRKDYPINQQGAGEVVSDNTEGTQVVKEY